MPVQGQILGGKYRLERLVGSGGFASVWAARNVMLDRLVALKILSENYARMPGFLPRFLREAKLASRSIHKTIVAVEDIDQTPDGLVYLVMELLEGHTLADELKGGKALTIERTLEIMSPTLEGLAAAHSRNIIHRDIKPANIFLTKEGSAGPRVRILDLGLAKDLLHDDELTSTDQMVGTPSYLAPEMFMGPQTRRWAPTADVFACGMLMFRMLAGGLPFDRSVAKLTPIEQFLARAEFYQNIGTMPGPAQYVHTLPDAIDAVVKRAICLDVGERYTNAGEMLAGLKEAAAALSGFDLPDMGEPTIDEIEDVTEMEVEPESEELSGAFGQAETRVDAHPFGMEVSDGRGEYGESSFEESLTTNPINRSPPHLQPVAGRTFAPSDGRPSQDARSVPRTLPPSEERRADDASRLVDGGVAGDAFPSYTAMDGPGGLTPQGASEVVGDYQARRSPPPSQPDLPSPSTMDRVASGSQPAVAMAQNFTDSRESPSPSVPAGPHVAGHEPQQGGLGPASPRDVYVPPTHPQKRMRATSPDSGSQAVSHRPSSAQGQPHRRSPWFIAGVALGVLVILFGLAAGGLFASWRLGYWGRHARQQGEQVHQPADGSSRLQGSSSQLVGGSGPTQGAAADDAISLEVHSVPPGASVVLDGQQVGATPYHTSLPRSDDERQLSVRAEGFEPVERMIRSDESQRLEFELRPLQP